MRAVGGLTAFRIALRNGSMYHCIGTLIALPCSAKIPCDGFTTSGDFALWRGALTDFARGLRADFALLVGFLADLLRVLPTPQS